MDHRHQVLTELTQTSTQVWRRWMDVSSKERYESPSSAAAAAAAVALRYYDPQCRLDAMCLLSI